MTSGTEEAHNNDSYPPEQLAVPILPPHSGQKGYWMVPLPTAPGQPTEWAPVVAYGRVSDSQQSFTPPPPSPTNPEWAALDNGDPIPIDESALSLPPSPQAPGPLPPVEWQVMEGGPNQGKKYTLLPHPPAATAPDSAAGNQGHAPLGLGQGVDWFVVPIPAPPGDGGEGPSSAPASGGEGGEVSPKAGGEILV
ncbi:unnamed protein product [Tuber aestivum]|uniref:Uncharacterized protein n=1 Tax=Tuber aestivum TaxID=59557 RepID=A0A292Q4A1_9PEZI|nr:unnamed protein product [Tuber aestivum]